MYEAPRYWCFNNSFLTHHIWCGSASFGSASKENIKKNVKKRNKNKDETKKKEYVWKWEADTLLKVCGQTKWSVTTELFQAAAKPLNFIHSFCLQISQEVPQPPSASLPVVSVAFDVLQFSVEISEQLQVFCNWSKRVLLYLKKQSCSKH